MINLKKSALALLAVNLITPVAFAEDPDPIPVDAITVQGGQIHFEGSVVNSPCVVENDSANQTVRLGQFQSSEFSGIGSSSSPVDFAVKLMNCDASVMKTATITFKGQTLEKEAQLLAPAATQAADIVASGVGIQILQDSAPVNVDGKKATAAQDLIDGNNSLLFQARYVATAASVGVGSASATADFTITYQ